MGQLPSSRTVSLISALGRKQKFKLRHHQNPMCGAKAIDDAMPELDSLVIGDAVYVLTGWPIMQALTREPYHCNVLRACSSDIV